MDLSAGKELLQQANKQKEWLISNRRALHQCAEIGFDLPKTRGHVCDELQKMGYAVQEIGGSICVAAGKKHGKAILLRADMDGLPIIEKTGASYACKSGNMHACGHDMHTAMLLGAAKLIKDGEEGLSRPVKILFQAAEERLEGAKRAIECGVLENVDCAVMLHVLTATPFESGSIIVSSEGVSAPSADYFEIKIQGSSTHGSMPHKGIDAIMAAAHVLTALEEISARELALGAPALWTVGKLQAGTAGNVIAERAVLEGTVRCFDEDLRQKLKKRIKEIAQTVAKAFRAKASVRFTSGCPSLYNDGELSLLAHNAAVAVAGANKVYFSADLPKGEGGGSEDFAYISRQVPSVMLALCAGQAEKGYAYPLHHPKTAFDEDVLPLGAALYAAIALANDKNR